MPRRSNLFQHVVAIIHERMAGAATVEESALLADRRTGSLREVDVVVRSQVAGYPVIVSVEATAGGRRADVHWVEQMIAKHGDLPTSQLVLVSDAGFTPEATRIAEAEGAVVMQPEDLTQADPAGQVVGKLKSLWPKLLALTPERTRLRVQRPDGTLHWVVSLPDNVLYLDDSTEVATVNDWWSAMIKKRFVEVANQLGLAEISEDLDAWFELETTGPHAAIDGERQDLFLRWEEVAPPELHRIVAVHSVGKAHIEVREVPLRHLKLGDVNVSAGETHLAQRKTILIVTEDEPGKPEFTLRFREPPEGKGATKPKRRRGTSPQQ